MESNAPFIVQFGATEQLNELLQSTTLGTAQTISIWIHLLEF